MNTLVALMIPGLVELLVIVLLWAVMVALPILVVLWFARNMLKNRRENTRLRLEVGKLADELERTRGTRDGGAVEDGVQ